MTLPTRIEAAELPTRGLLAELEQAENCAAQLRLKIKQSSCVQVGHSWQFYGGCNAGCGEGCGCSVPVYVCAKCGDCDYGDSAEAAEIREDCAILRAERKDDEHR